MASDGNRSAIRMENGGTALKDAAYYDRRRSAHAGLSEAAAAADEFVRRYPPGTPVRVLVRRPYELSAGRGHVLGSLGWQGVEVAITKPKGKLARYSEPWRPGELGTAVPVARLVALPSARRKL